MLCLVLAMSGTSALLGWIDGQSRPSGATAAAFTLTPAQITGLVETVVAQTDKHRLAHWESVDIVSASGSRENLMLLAAEQTPTRNDHPSRLQAHFRIDETGRPFATNAWIQQIPLERDPTAVSIEVVRTGDGQPMTPTQWQCVRSLISELSTLQEGRLVVQRTGSVEGRTLPIRLHGSWSAAGRTSGSNRAPALSARSNSTLRLASVPDERP